jgi:DNA-directed RNA polymerase subunit RPC12/RpoP
MENNPEIKEENVKRHSCQNCGADMIFDPKVGKLACPYCAAQKTIQTNLADIVERDFESFLRPETERLQPLAKDAMQVSCDSCGATVTFIPPETATSCDFCAAKIVAQPKVADPLVAPEGVLPFSVENKQAISSLKQWTSSRWFAPSALKTMAQHDRAESIYLPYWTFDAQTETFYQGQRGDDYQEKEYYTDSEGKEQERLVTRTDWSHASGNVSRHFDDVPVPATKSVLPNYIKNLNWDFTDLTSYDPGYLSGHKAQTYQVSLEEGYEQFQGYAENIIRGDCRKDIGGDKQRVDSMDTSYSEVTFKHILVPVYAGAYKFNNKVYQIIVNGRTGEVQGERPYSKLKIGCLVVSILALIIFFILLVSIIGALK